NNLDESKNDDLDDITDRLLARLEATHIDNEIKTPTQPKIDENIRKPKINRQQERKRRKAAKLAEMQREAEEDANNQVNMREVELNAIKDLAERMGLIVEEIVPDGHCLYNAISDQLRIRYQMEADYKKIRKGVAAYMRNNVDEFVAFIPNTQDGELCSLEQFNKYCDDIENTAVWGGEIELRAISKVYKVPVHIVQMDSPLLKMSDDEFPGKEPMTISFHRYMYGLGAHYNSLRTTL
ncbi:3010_t:CDS:2, partial [Acaulospora colombiana]